MALAASLKLGEIKGPSLIKGREGEIPVVGFEHRLASVTDPKTGLPTRDRRHGTLTVRKNVDFASPHIREAHTKDRELAFALRFFRNPRSGSEYNYLTVVLTRARVVSVKLVMPVLTDPKNSNVHEYEEVGFAYESIAWQNEAPPQGLESGGFPSKTAKVVQARFGPDWLEEKAKAEVLAKLGLLTEKAKDALVDHLKEGWDETEPK